MNRKLQIGEALIEGGFITQSQLERAIEIQKNTPNKRLGDILIDLSYITSYVLAKCLASQLRLEMINLSDYPIDSTAAALIDRDFAIKKNVLPIGFKNNSLLVATSDPLAFYNIDAVSAATDYEVITVVVEKEAFNQAVESVYSQTVVRSAADDLDREISTIVSDESLALADERLEGTPLAKLINSILSQAALLGASDIHFEPTKNSLVVRLRINGDLVRHLSMKMAAHTAIVTRIKVLSEMDIAEKRIPQDGKFQFVTANMRLDIRSSSLPTIYGEKIVLRLLGNSNRPELQDLNKIGMSLEHLEMYKAMIKNPNGIILITGPTGSGKTTTLYATLNLLAKRNTNIVTIEDPVEQRIDSINQVQVNTRAGLTFATALRSILRQDPDVIMVGEMRDNETAMLGMRASITGHLVFSTLHTNDTIASIARMIDIGAPAYMVAAALTGVIAQRLVKTLCPVCKKPHPITKQEKQLLGAYIPDETLIYTPVGCHKCNQTGYSGRLPVYEVLSIDANLRTMITQGSSVAEMKDYEKSKGTVFLRDSITSIVLAGNTSIEEMEKIVFTGE